MGGTKRRPRGLAALGLVTAVGLSLPAAPAGASFKVFPTTVELKRDPGGAEFRRAAALTANARERDLLLSRAERAR